MPHGWFAFRKMYLLAAFVTALMIGASLLNIPLMVAESNAALVEAGNYADAMNQALELMMNAGPGAMICSFAGAALKLIVRVISALFADSLYRDRVISVVNESREAEDREEFIMKKGGINLFAFAIAMMAESLLFQIIGSFFV